MTKQSDNVKIHVTIPRKLLAQIDDAANRDFANRSEIIRAALLWYLRPDGVNFGLTEPEALLTVLRREETRKGLNKLIKQRTQYRKLE